MNDIGIIWLYSGRFVLVDIEDREELRKIKWHRRGDYASTVSHPEKDGQVFMHRLINKTPKNLLTDHVNGYWFDNRKTNLRNATKQQNAHNCIGKRGFSSTYKGVYYRKANKKWSANIRTPEGMLYLGVFIKEEDAAKAYDEAARKYHKEFAKLNFPNEEYAPSKLKEETPVKLSEKEKLRKKIGQNIRDLCKEMYGPRKERQMAKDLKMSQGSFSEIVNGLAFPSCMTIVKLGRLMDTKGNTQNNFNSYGLCDILEI